MVGTPAEAPAAPPALRATVVPPEVEIHEGRLYATVWLNRDADQPVELHLRGQGAPTDVVTIPAGRQACPGIDFEFGVAEGSWSVAHDRGCSWDSTQLSPGTYELEATSGGARVGFYSFRILEVPASGAELSLQVDPDSRGRIAYVHPRGLAYWFPVDARYESRTLSFVFFRDGELAGTRRVTLEGPRFRGGGVPLSVVRPAFIRAAPAGRADWHLAAFVDEEMIGSWHYAYGQDGRWRGIRAIRGETNGPLEAGPLPDALLDRALAEVRGQHSVMRHERRICAVAFLPEAIELLSSLGGAASANGGEPAAPGAAGEPAPGPRWEDTTTTTGRDAATRLGAAYADALRQLDRLAARFEPGCMAPPPAE